jgi:O-antigen/teichoic acid export membrane protein
MRFPLRRLLPERFFLRKLSMLVGGTIAGQAILVLASPLLTRLFTPAEFGLFGVFAALTSIAAVASALRFEFAIPNVKDDQTAAALAMVAALSSAGLALLLLLPIWLFGDRFAMLLKSPNLVSWLWFLPLAVFCFGLSGTLAYWSLRRGHIAINAISRTLKFGGQAGGQILLGLANGGVFSLIMGYVIGLVASFAHYALRLSPSDRSLICTQPPKRLGRAARENWRYPTFSLPTALLESLCQHTPVLLLVALYDPSIGGFYALAQRVIGMPVRMLSEAASQVFHGELRTTKSNELFHLFLRTLFLFLGLGITFMIPLFFLGPWLFSLVFGAPWRDAGAIVQILMPLYFLRFILSPISQLLYFINHHSIYFLFSIISFLSLAGSFGAGYMYAFDAFKTLLLFSILSSLSFLVHLGITWMLVRNASRRWIPVPGAE